MTNDELHEVWRIGRESGFDEAVRALIVAQSDINEHHSWNKRDIAIKARDAAYLRVMQMYAAAVGTPSEAA